MSSWNRAAPNTFPAAAKSTANYANSTLIKMEAMLDGYAEGIALDTLGYVSEGSGQNLFIVRKNVIYTPPVHSSILGGITRDSILTIARGLGYDVREEVLPREILYLADEAFFCGTAVEVTPIRSIDRIAVGSGRRPGDRRDPPHVLRHRQRRTAGYPRVADFRLRGRSAAAGGRRNGGRPGAIGIRRTLRSAVLLPAPNRAAPERPTRRTWRPARKCTSTTCSRWRWKPAPRTCI